MYNLDQSTIRRWLQFNNFWFPESVGTNCPFCAEKVNFATTLFDYDRGMDTITSRATCPNCGETVYIWGIHPGPADDPLKKGCACVAMFPAPQLSRQPIEGSDLIPDRVRKAYLDTIGAFNAGIWSLTAGSCRRTLEGILSNILSQSKTKGALANQIQQLTENIDLQQPLITLADAVRTGGNIGAHFDAEKEADQETAQVMLDLIEYLLEYVYTLPGMVEKLNKRIAILGKTPNKKAIIKGKHWDEPEFLQELRTKRTDNDVVVATCVLNWARDKHLRLIWGQGEKYGSVYPTVEHEGISYSPISLWTDGFFDVRFQMLVKVQPFDRESKWCKLQVVYTIRAS